MSKFKKIVEEEKIKNWVVQNYQRLDESSFSRVMTTYFDKGFIIVSSDRSCEAEKGRECTAQEIKSQAEVNNENNKKIHWDFTRAKFGFVPTYGGFKEKKVAADGTETYIDSPHPERSYIVPNNREDMKAIKKLGMDICTKYNQDSFLFKPPQSQDTKAYFLDRNGNVQVTFEGRSISDLTQQYYTHLRSENPIKRFSLKEWVLYVPKPPTCATAAFERYGEIFLDLF